MDFLFFQTSASALPDHLVHGQVRQGQKSLNSAISVSRSRTITSFKHSVNVKWRKSEYIPGLGFGFAINTKRIC